MGITGKELLENYKKRRQGNNVSSEEAKKTTETQSTQITGAQLLDSLNSIKNAIEVDNIVKSEDFATKSGYASTKSDNWWDEFRSAYGLGYNDLTYEYINNQNGLRDEINRKYQTFSRDNVFAESESDFKQKGYDFIKENEVALYNYYYSTEGKEKAQEYLDSLEDELVQRKAGKEYLALEGETLKELFYGVVAGADQWRQGVENFGDYIVGGDGFTSSTQYVSEKVRDDLADDGFKVLGSSVGQIGYDLINTTTNMLPSILVGSVTGGLGGAVAMGVPAVGNSYAEMRGLGYDDGQARAYATLVGISEAGLQYALGGISKLGGKLSGKAVSNLVSKFDNAIAKAAIRLGGNMASEGLEEGIQTILEPAFKALATGEDFESPKWEEVFYSALLGALSAGALEGIPTVRNAVAQTKADIQAKRIYGDNQAIQDLLVEAVDIGGEAANVADRYIEKYGKRGTLSGANLNAIINANEQAMVAQDKAKIKSVAEAKLAEYGETGDVSVIADILAKQASGEKLTSKETKLLNQSKSGHLVSTELNREKLKHGGLANDWAADIGTNRINADVYNRDLYELALQKENVKYPSKYTSVSDSSDEAKGAKEVNVEVSDNGKNMYYDAETDSYLDADIKSIVSTKGGIKVELENGKTVSASDIRYATREEGVVYEMLARMDVTPETANEILNTFKPSNEQQADLYFDSIPLAYRMGLMGNEQGLKYIRLSDAQKRVLYNRGRIDATINAKERDSARATSPKKATDKASYEKKGIIFENGVVYDEANANDLQRAGMAGAEAIAKTTNLEVHVFDSPLASDPNGYFKDGNKIYINISAGMNAEGAMLYALSHEVTHYIRKWNAQGFKELADFLVAEYGKNGVDVNSLIERQKEKIEKRYSQNGWTLPNDAKLFDMAYEEMVADAMSDMLADPNAYKKLAKLKKKNFKLWQKLGEVIKNLLDKLKNALNIYRKDSPVAVEAFKVRDFTAEAYNKLQDLYIKAFVEADNNYSSAEQTLVESGIAVNSDTDSASILTVRDVLNDEQRKKVSSALATRFGVTQEEAMDWLKAETSMASLILNPKYSQYLDYTPDPNEVAIKTNSDYPQGTVDFSPICAKRREFTSVMNNILRLFPNHVFAATDLAKIRTIMQEEGMTIPCGICYVEDRRQLDTIVAQNFIDSLKLYREGSKTRPDGKPFNANQLKGLSLIDGDSYIPSVYELVSLEGLNVLKEKNPNMAEAWVKFNNARGMQSVRLLANEAEYKRQILKYTKSTVKTKNDKGGLRVYSFSDAEMFHLIDIIQVITDSATVGLSLQGYTKVNEYARAVKDTGEKLNRSLIPKGELGYHIEDGKVILDYDTVEGIDINHPDFFDNRDNPNIGNITIGVSDVQIRAAMVSDFVDQIIPFHTGQSDEVLGEKGIATWTNYKDFQKEKDIATGTASDHQINIYTEVLQVLEKEGKPINKRTFVEKFLQVCKDNGLTPRFSQFLNTNEKGEYVYTEGYHKMLVDFKTFAQTEVGEYLPQMPVKPIFDNAYITKILKDYVKSQKVKDAELAKSMPRVIERITNEIVKPSEDVQHGEVMYSDRVLMGSLFSGGGTLEAGLAYQMLDKQFGVEYDGRIASVYADNHGDHIQVGRVEDFDISQYDDIFYLHASPVCHNFSKAKHGAKELQMDIDSAKATAKHLETAMPQVFTVENAPGYRKSESLKIITSKLTELGYKWDVDVYNSADYGSASSRNRVILRAVKEGELPSKPTKQDRTNSWDKVTKDLWKTLPKSYLRPSFISAIENTRNLPILDANGKVNVNKPLLILTTTNGHTVTYCWEGEICPTLTTKCGEAKLVMPDGNIYAVTPEFMGRIQGLPDDYKYPKEKTRAFTIIGNGIPTHLTKAVIGGVLDSAYEQTHNGEVLYSGREIAPITETDYKDLEKHFGTTGNFKVAGYLLTDGKLLDFSGKHWGDTTSRSRQVDHRDVQEVLGRGNNGINDMVDMIGNGNIRLMPEVGGINLAVYPNEKQRRVLSIYIKQMLATEGQVIIDYDTVGGDTVYSRTYEKGATSSRILSDIRNYFNGGRQSDLMRFHTEFSDADITYSVREEAPPKETKRAYKLMRLVDGKLYPLFIGNNEEVAVGTWYNADSPNLSQLKDLAPGTHLVDMKTGEAMTWDEYAEKHVPLKNGKPVRSKPNVEDIHWANDNGYRFMHIEEKAGGKSEGTMLRKYGDTRAYYNWGVNGSSKTESGEGSASLYALRPGWHFGEVPSMHQIGYGGEDGETVRLDNQVWVEVEMSADVDYNAEAEANWSGDIPTHIPTNGYYRYATNPTQKKTKGGNTENDATKADWYVAGAFKVNRIMSDYEADAIVENYNKSTGRNVPLDYRRNYGRVFNAETMRVEDAPKYSDRDTDAVSNRTLLANALESVAQNDIEKAKLAQYKSKIALIESEQKKLNDLKAKANAIRFTKGRTSAETKQMHDLEFEANQTANRINTYDKQLLNLESTKALKNVLEREKTILRKRLEQKGKEALNAQRAKNAETVREIMTRNTESRKKAVEGRHKTEMRHKIQKVVSDLNKLLLNPTKEQHVPIGLQKVVADALDAINMDTMNAEERVKYYNDLIAKATNPDTIKELTRKRDFFEYRDMNFKERITALKNAYAEFKESDDPLIRNAHNDAIADLISNTASAVGNASLKDMSYEQLEAVYDMYKAVLATVRNANKMFKEGRQETVTENSEAVKVEVKEVGGHQERVLKATKFLKKAGWDMLKPVTAMKVIGSKTLAGLFDNVRAAEDTWAVDVNEAKEFYKNISNKYGYNKWDFKTQHSFKDSRGEEFSISLEQMMSLYAYSKREQADEHLEFGGFIFDDAIEVTEKNKVGIPLKYEVNDANPHRLGQIQMMEIIGKLTQEQKAFIDEMQAYLSDVMGAKGNEVSLALYDIKLYKEKNYFPLKTARYFREFDPEKSGTPKIKNSGFSKKTVPQAGNPIVLSNFMDVWASHVNDMSMYHAFVLPLEDFMRVYNYSSTAGGYDSVQQYIKNAYGSQANQYIERLMDDLNGGARVDSSAGIINKGLSLFKKASVFASASVVIQQPSAIARAFAYINPKYFATSAGSALNLKKHKEVWAEIKKYAPVAVIKEMGYFDTGMGRSTVEWIKGNKTIKDKMDDVLSKAPAYADELSWSYIWLAVKKEIQATTNLNPGTEEFLKKAGERFTEIITNTQVYDSVLARSGMMRSKDTGMKMATAFMAEPTTTVNMMVDGILQGKRGNKKFMASTVGAISASIILNSILVALVYAARDDDEDETYTEKYVGSLTTELLDGFNPLTYIPFVKDAWSIAQGYDVERSDMSVVSNLWESIEGLFNEDKSGWEKVADATGAVSSLFGIPLKNLIRDAKGMYNLTETLLSGTPTTGAGLSDAIGDAFTSSIPLWDRLNESDSKTDKLYDALMSGDQNHISRIRSGYANEKAFETAMRQALRDNDSRIKEAAQARLEGDISKYTRIAKEIIREGNFSQDIVVGAINAEMNAIKRGETTEAEPTEEKDEVTSIYSGSDVNSAFDNGDFALAQEIIADLIDTKVANGMEEKNAKTSLRSSMTSYWKPLYKEAYQSGDTNEMARIRRILYSSGLYGTANEVVKTTQNWLKD